MLELILGHVGCMSVDRKSRHATDRSILVIYGIMCSGHRRLGILCHNLGHKIPTLVS